MYPLLVLLFIIPSTSAFVDCRAACRICRDKSEHPSALEVHCAMCEECKLRRRDRLRGGNNYSQKSVPPFMMQENLPRGGFPYPGFPAYPGYPGFMPPFMGMPPPIPVMPGYSDDCPTPPICGSSSSSSDEVPRIELKGSSILTTTTTSSTTTTTKRPRTKRPCPPIPQCVRRLPAPMPVPVLSIVPGYMMSGCGGGVMPMQMPNAIGIPPPPPPPIFVQPPFNITQTAPSTQPQHTTVEDIVTKAPATTTKPLDPPITAVTPDPTKSDTSPSGSAIPDGEDSFTMPDTARQIHQQLKHIIHKKTTSKDFFYVYVGLPKKVSKHNDLTRIGLQK